jgi:NADH:ubiquinone oxidoreductase subunit F (NADH-binding)
MEREARMSDVYTICGHPAWSDKACQKCDGCRNGRRQMRATMSAANNVMAYWDNDKSGLEPAMDELRAVLEWREASVTNRL